jgi:CDGSH-type Zn-finger protein/truncated hemoglobin YjbI
LCANVEALVVLLEGQEKNAENVRLMERLRDSVVRPLRSVLDGMSLEPAAPAAETAPQAVQAPDAILWTLARDATPMVTNPAMDYRLGEAIAGLQILACRGSIGERQNRIAQLAQLQAGAAPAVAVLDDGPYVATNIVDVVDWAGRPVLKTPITSFCRCGRSADKPYCDGTHATVLFSGAKDPERVPDRLDVYPGLTITVVDNRGTCAHSGFCTDRLNTVFHQRSEPFVTPTGGRMDEIIRAVRECPSGALSLQVNEQEARDLVDQSERLPRIEVTRDGPYRLTGSVRVVDAQGDPVPRNQGASQEHCSLCRCGRSRNKPYCSGMHWYADFHDPIPDADREPTLFEWAGGLPAFERLARRFYETHVPADPVLAPVFSHMTTDHPERVAAWLAEVFGGPKTYSTNYGGYEHMVSEHLGANLSEAQRARFVALLCKSADDVGMPSDAEFRAAFVSYLEWGSRIALENSQPGAKPPAHMPVPRWWWVCDATPGSRASSLAPSAQDDVGKVEFPHADEQVSFVRHIQPMFRRRDRDSMRFALDLWSLADVKAHAPQILERLSNGSMPCDGAWPREKVQVFARWVATNMQE